MLIRTVAAVSLLAVCAFAQTTPSPYQVNSPVAKLSIDGQLSTGGDPVMDLQWVRESSVVTVDSQLVGTPWDLGITATCAVAVGSGGLQTPGGQAVNLDIFHPSFTWLNGGTFATPFAAPLAVTFSSPVPTTFAMQMVAVAPLHPDGIVLSAPSIMAVERVCAQDIVVEGLDPMTVATAPIAIYETQAPVPVAPGAETSLAATPGTTTGTMTLDLGTGTLQTQTISIDNATGMFMVGGTQASMVGQVFPGMVAIPGGTASISLSLSAPVTIDIGVGIGVIIRAIIAAKTWVTDKGKVVKVFCDGRPGSPDLTQAEVDAILMGLGLPGMVTQVCPASDSYDCHGYTFACGLKWINNDQVQKILDDNGYTCVPAAGMSMPGDIVVYTNGGGITHTGIVKQVDAMGNVTKVTSKWGSLPKFEHGPTVVPPSYGTPKVYTKKRAGNKLKCKSTP